MSNKQYQDPFEDQYEDQYEDPFEDQYEDDNTEDIGDQYGDPAEDPFAPEQEETVPEETPRKAAPKKKKQPSAAAQIALTVCMGIGLFAAVCGITWFAIGLREGKKKSSSESAPQTGVMEVHSSTTSTSAAQTAPSLTETTETGTSETEQTTTDSVSEATESTTTVSTRIIPGEDEYPYFTRSYTFPDEASQDETTTSGTAADPVKERYAGFGAVLQKFLRERTSADSAPMYALTDLDGDGEPELIVSGGTGAKARAKVFSYEKGVPNDLKSASGGPLNTLYLSGEGQELLLVELSETDSELRAVSYKLEGGRLIPQHSYYHPKDGNYAIDDTVVTEINFNLALNREAFRPAGREIALPGKPEELTAVGGVAL